MIDAKMRERVVALLKALEGFNHCPVCHRMRWNLSGRWTTNHESDCELAAVLRELEVGDE